MSAPCDALVSSTKDNCMGSDCPHWQDCHVNQARQQALVVVVNHHLLFADLDVRDSGMAHLLPNTGVVVIDESTATTSACSLPERLCPVSSWWYARDALQLTQEHHAAWPTGWCSPATLEQAVRELRLQAASSGRRAACVASGDPAGTGCGEMACGTGAAGQSLRALLIPLSSLEGRAELQRLHDRGAELLARLARFAAPADDECVRWLEVGAQYLRMLESPLSIARIMQQRLLQRSLEDAGAGQARSRSFKEEGLDFHSATLGNDAQLSWFVESCLRGAQVLQVESPFDYHRQAGVYVPQPLLRLAAHSTASRSPRRCWMQRSA
jgi:ATP-dependent DNA helicase DinG